MAALIVAAQTVSAQEKTVGLEPSKTFDNVYIGVHGGLAKKTTHSEGITKNLNPTAGIRVGRYFTPVFGLALDGTVYFNNKPDAKTGTTLRGLDADLLGTVNFSNWFCGYKGEPRVFEISGIIGLGMTKVFSNGGYYTLEYNDWFLNNKLALNFAFNLGSKKAWQIYIEPGIQYYLTGERDDSRAKFVHSHNDHNSYYNINRSELQLNAGIVYKFGNSNGTHNFKNFEGYGQAYVDELNAKINSLQGQVSDKDGQIGRNKQRIAELESQLRSAQATAAAAANMKPTEVVKEVVKKESELPQRVIFRQGKSTIDPAQYASIEMVAKYMKNHKDAKLLVQGYASPEGSKEINQKISEARANAVKNALVNKYKIAANRISIEGLGATDKLYKEADFNRVALFFDTTIE